MTTMSGRGSSDQPTTHLLPCSTAQKRCWFVTQLQPDSSVLNICIRWELRGPFTSHMIEEAFRTVIGRHEILRTRFVEVDGAPYQDIAEHFDFKVSVVDLTMLPALQQAAQVQAILEREASEPFDLNAAPLLRAVLARFTENEATLLITAHQAVFDGWSIRVLGREIGCALEALEAGRPIALPDLQLQYGDFALWQQEFEAQGGYVEDEAFWTGKLRGLSYFEVAPDFPRGDCRSSKTSIIAEQLPIELGREVEREAQRHGVSVFSYEAAIVAFALSRFTELDDIAVGTQIAGRHDADLETLIGVFINNIVLRFDTSGQSTFKELLARSHETVCEALAHDKLPFNRLVGLMNVTRDPARTPLISVNLMIQRAFMEDTRYGPFELSGKPSRSPGSLYDLTFQMIGRDDGWRASLEYNADLYNDETARRLFALWGECRRRAVANCDDPLSVVRAAPRPSKDVPDLAVIERRMTAIDGVAEAAAVLNPATGGVRAFVVPLPIYAEPLECLIQAVEQQLGDRTLEAVTALMAIPRTIDGAPDKAKLAQLIARSPVRVAPRNDAAGDIERRMIEIWRTVLAVEEVGPHSNFFEIGGDSMLALRMIVRVEKEFGARLEVASLFRAPDLRTFAGQLRAKQELSDWRIVTVQNGGAGTPVFAINNSIMYYNLAKTIGAHHPFIGLQPYDPTSPRMLPDRSFEDIVADYVQLIRSVRKKGPYILVGLCVAGAIAFEAAQQLRRAGEEVPLLIMMDTWAPQHAQSLPLPTRIARSAMARVNSLRRRWARLRRGEYTLAEFLGSYGIVRKLRLLELAVQLGLLRETPPLEDWENRWFLNHLLRACSQYRPAPYDGDVAVFTSDEVPSGPMYDPQLGWSPIVRGKLTVRHVCHAHMRFCEEPSVGLMAAEMRPYLTGST